MAVDVLEPGDPSVDDVALGLNHVVVAVFVDVDHARAGLHAEGSVLAEVEGLVLDPVAGLAVGVFEPDVDAGDVDVTVTIDVSDGHASVNRRIRGAGELVLDERSVGIGGALVPPHAVVRERDDLGHLVAVEIGVDVVVPRDDARRMLLERRGARRMRVSVPIAA